MVLLYSLCHTPSVSYTHLDVYKRQTVGYSRKGHLERDSRIAAIPIGYADGLNLSLIHILMPAPTVIAVEVRKAERSDSL